MTVEVLCGSNWREIALGWRDWGGRLEVGSSFHSVQVLAAAIRQYGELIIEEDRRLVLVAATHYLAAHAPTQRELQQTLRIALRLHRGDPVYEAD